MPRTPRIDIPGARHHVMNRTSRRRIVFRDADDLALFQRLLSELPGRFATRVHGWALMGNHFHAMLETPAGRLPSVMAWLGGELARKMNARHGWDGPLFRGRYRNRVVLDDSYWQHLLAYLHLNPVAARLIAHPDQSVWTSHRAYAGLDVAPPWLSRDELYELYGSDAQYREAIDELVAGRNRLPAELDEDLLWRVPSTGGSALERLPAAVSTLTLDEALGQVAVIADVSLQSLLCARLGRTGNVPRTLAAWWLGRAAAMTRVEIAEALGLTPLAVAGAANRVRAADGALAVWRDALEADRWAPLLAEAPLKRIEEQR